MHLTSIRTKEATKAKSDLNNAQVEITQVRGELERVKTELAIHKAARRSALASLNEQLKSETTDKESAERSLRDLQVVLTSATQTNAANAAEIKAKADENTALRERPQKVTT